jgi:hypothetical protein
LYFDPALGHEVVGGGEAGAQQRNESGRESAHDSAGMERWGADSRVVGSEVVDVGREKAWMTAGGDAAWQLPHSLTRRRFDPDGMQPSSHASSYVDSTSLRF